MILSLQKQNSYDKEQYIIHHEEMMKEVKEHAKQYEKTRI